MLCSEAVVHCFAKKLQQNSGNVVAFQPLSALFGSQPSCETAVAVPVAGITITVKRALTLSMNRD
jgi:hypothetical protein